MRDDDDDDGVVAERLLVFFVLGGVVAPNVRCVRSCYTECCAVMMAQWSPLGKFKRVRRKQFRRESVCVSALASEEGSYACKHSSLYSTSHTQPHTFTNACQLCERARANTTEFPELAFNYFHWGDTVCVCMCVSSVEADANNFTYSTCVCALYLSGY